MPSIPDRVSQPTTSHKNEKLATLVESVCAIRGCESKYLPDWMQKRDYINALHGFLNTDNTSINRVNKQGLVALYTVCYGSDPPDEISTGELRAAIADEIHYHHDYDEDSTTLQVETLQYGVMALAANHLSEQKSITAETISMPKQPGRIPNPNNEYTSFDENGRRYSRENLTDFLQDLAEDTGEPVTASDVDQAEGPSVATITNRFGGFPEARKAAGLQVKVPKGAPKKYSDSDIFDYIRKLTRQLGRPPTERDIREANGVSLSTIQNRFGSLGQARNDAGVGHPDPEEVDETSPGRRAYPRESLIDHIQLLAFELGRPPTVDDISQRGGPSIGPYNREFGGIKSAREAANVGHPTTKANAESESNSQAETETDPKPEYDNSELLDHLKELTEQLGHPPSMHDINTADGPKSSLYLSRFGGVPQAREEAGVGHPRTIEELSFANKDIIED